MPASASTPAPSRRCTRRSGASPNDPEILLELARTQLGAGQPQAALANLDNGAQRARRTTCRCITARGIALDRLSRHAEAQETYRAGSRATRPTSRS